MSHEMYVMKWVSSAFHPYFSHSYACLCMWIFKVYDFFFTGMLQLIALHNQPTAIFNYIFKMRLNGMRGSFLKWKGIILMKENDAKALSLLLILCT